MFDDMLDTEMGRAVCSGRLDVGLPESVHDYIDWKRRIGALP